jgi:hypothetical protein
MAVAAESRVVVFSGGVEDTQGRFNSHRSMAKRRVISCFATASTVMHPGVLRFTVRSPSSPSMPFALAANQYHGFCLALRWSERWSGEIFEV